MHKKTAYRWRLSAVLMAGVGFAIGSFWLLTIMQGNEADMHAAAMRNEPDYIVEKFSFVRMSDAGAPHYIFSGAKLTHRPVDDASDVEKPQLRAMNPGQPVMTISAKQARIMHADNVVHLQGNVSVERPSAPGVQNMTLTTEAMTILPDEDKMETDKAVNMVLGSNKMQGVGMQANNATQKMHLAAQSKMTLAPRTRNER
jgi:lipopolysaccharide export system protein LptC